MKIDPHDVNSTDSYKLLTGCVVPRPIAWVSTVGEDGILNVAPFSFFNVIATNPPTLMVAIGRRAGEKKDTVRNAEYSGDFVVNVVTEDLAEVMNLTSGEYPPEVDEFALAKLTPVAGDKVRSPRVAESPINIECKLVQVLDLGSGPARHSVLLGEVVQFHVRDDIYYDGKINFAKLKPLGRLAGDLYCRTSEIVEIKRPRG